MSTSRELRIIRTRMGIMNTHSEERKGDKAKSSIDIACRKFLQKLGGHATHPLLFQQLADIALKDFQLRLDSPCDKTDICFLRNPDPAIFHKVSTMNRARRRIKRKYEDVPDGLPNPFPTEG